DEPELLASRIRETLGRRRFLRPCASPLLIHLCEEPCVDLSDVLDRARRRDAQRIEDGLMDLRLSSFRGLSPRRDALRRLLAEALGWNLSKRVPRAEDRMVRSRGAFEVTSPTPERARLDVVLSHRDARLPLVGVADRRQEIAPDLPAQLREQLLVLRGHEILVSLLPPCELLLEFRVSLRLLGLRDERQIVRLDRVLEDVVERVVVGSRARLVLVVVAAGALDREAHEAA